MENKVKYKGSCHCASVKFEVWADKKLEAIECNCSICYKKQVRNVIVPSKEFKLLIGHKILTTYTFNTHQAKHMFCSLCGTECFYVPRSNPDGIAFMPHCIDNPVPEKILVESFDGLNWEKSMEKSGDSLRARSKIN